MATLEVPNVKIVLRCFDINVIMLPILCFLKNFIETIKMEKTAT